jgi:hypothetical protein
VLEADALHGIVQLHVDAEVVGVELELVAGLDAAVFLDVQGEGGHRAVAGELPVVVMRGLGVEGDVVLLVCESNLLEFGLPLLLFRSDRTRKQAVKSETGTI